MVYLGNADRDIAGCSIAGAQQIRSGSGWGTLAARWGVLGSGLAGKRLSVAGAHRPRSQLRWGFIATPGSRCDARRPRWGLAGHNGAALGRTGGTKGFPKVKLM